jgi:hypothetical protein
VQFAPRAVPVSVYLTMQISAIVAFVAHCCPDLCRYYARAKDPAEDRFQGQVVSMHIGNNLRFTVAYAELSRSDVRITGRDCGNSRARCANVGND